MEIAGSNPVPNTKMGSYTVGVAEQTVNLLVSASGGSTPSLPTIYADERDIGRAASFSN